MSETRRITGDARSVLPLLPARSVHLVVTSPPYWSIKDYKCAGQIGHGQTIAEYVAALSAVWAECFRVLHPGCRMAVNIGDQFLRARDHGRYRVAPLGAYVIGGAGEAGFDYMGSILWLKITNTATTGGGAFMGSMYYPKDGHVTFEHEYIMLFRKPGKWPKPSAAAKAASKLTLEERSQWFRGTWRVPPARQVDGEAPFPLEIPRRLIRMYSFAGETVLDPFAGTGTTEVAAVQAGRNSITIDIRGRHAP